MRVLWVMRHAGYIRNFESTLRLLCERGHHVHVAFQHKTRYAQLDPNDSARQLAETYPTFSSGDAPIRDDGWGLLGREVRLGLDHLRYARPEYRDAPKLRERAAREAPAAVVAKSASGLWATSVGRRARAAWLAAVHRAIPSDSALHAFLDQAQPDVLALTPLIEPGAPQAELVRCARAVGIRTVLCVASWDNLTNKGLIHGSVDLMTVWNEPMKREAVTMHGVPASRVVVTGAAAFDHWFEWRPSTTKTAFCERVGLPPARPYVLYVCSSKFIAPDEAAFVRRWAEAIRGSSSSTLRDAGILVRPHPQHAEQWQHVDLRSLGVSVWPRAGAAPVDTATRNEYFDSIHHAAVVVGVNTTAEIESAILGRRVCTFLAPEFRATQEGTLHFRHLRQVNGGLVHTASDLETHLAHLDVAVREPTNDDARGRAFVEAFVRPHGRDVAATPRLVEALEGLARTGRARPERTPLWASLVRRVLRRRVEELERRSTTDRASSSRRAVELPGARS